MKTWVFAIITILYVVVSIFLLSKLINVVIRMFNNSNVYHEGMIYNPKEKKLEADNKEIDVL